MTTVTVTTDIVAVTCCICGVPFGLPEQLKETRRKDGQTFWCPNGHGQHFTEHEDLKKELAKAKRRLTEALDSENWWREEAEAATSELKQTKNRLRGTKAELTKTRKRVSGGVCPCCHRQFVQLARHMQTKHPDYAAAE